MERTVQELQCPCTPAHVQIGVNLVIICRVTCRILESQQAKRVSEEIYNFSTTKMQKEKCLFWCAILKFLIFITLKLHWIIGICPKPHITAINSMSNYTPPVITTFLTYYLICSMPFTMLQNIVPNRFLLKRSPKHQRYILLLLPRPQL